MAAIANWGEIDGVRLLKKETVEKMLAKPVLSPPNSNLLEHMHFTQGGLFWARNQDLNKMECLTPAGVMARDDEVQAGWL